MDYKTFSAAIEFSSEDEVFVGKVLDIDSLILFSAVDVDGLKKEFYQAVDAYLEHCRAQGLAPEKPCKGTFNVRIGPDLHRQAVTLARTLRRSLNDFVREAVQIHIRASARSLVQSEEPILLQRVPIRAEGGISPWSHVSEQPGVLESELEGSSRVYN
ncbi:MAG TPA: type II toxin-antitoxin system HicB family antitoxin [Rhodanobacteraceae bacterium]|nr:type II toxin-antitoxin system HicB family antitoxin [Rhodanobacteraceae bacterium]